MVQALKNLKMISQNLDINSQHLPFQINLRKFHLLKMAHYHKLMRMSHNQYARQMIKFYTKQGQPLIEIKS